MRSLLFVLFISVFTCSSAYSQTQAKSNEASLSQSDVKQLDEYVNAFFIKYKNEGSNKAIDYIFSFSKLNLDLTNLKGKLDSLQGPLGSFDGYRLIWEKNVVDGLVLRSYFVKHENHPIRFKLMFYKPRDKWVIYRFNLDADVADELEQSGKSNLSN